MTDMRKITLVLGGSGLCYPAYVGAITALLEHDLYPDCIHAVSGGALVAALFASGYGRHSNPTLLDLVLDTLPAPNNLYDKSWMPLTKKYGVYKGNAIEKKIRSLVKPSFYDMICDLHIYCTDIQRNSTVVFSRLQYELMESYNLDVATCVRASLSLPFIFDYVECKDRENRRMILVDGGVTNNFPMDAASYKPRQLDMHRKLPHETSPKVSNTNVIGIRVQSKQETAYNAKCTSSLSTFAQANLSSMMEALENQHVPTELWPRVITIQTQESSLNLNLSRQEALHLYQEGYDQTTLALRTRIEL